MNVLHECIYCEKTFGHTGQIKTHLRAHVGMRPYKCALCNYRHWYKTPMQNIHFVNVHHRKGLLSEIETDIEEEKRMEAKVEEDANEIRANRVNVMNGQPVPA